MFQDRTLLCLPPVHEYSFIFHRNKEQSEKDPKAEIVDKYGEKLDVRLLSPVAYTGYIQSCLDYARWIHRDILPEQKQAVQDDTKLLLDSNPHNAIQKIQARNRVFLQALESEFKNKKIE